LNTPPGFEEKRDGGGTDIAPTVADWEGVMAGWGVIVFLPHPASQARRAVPANILPIVKTLEKPLLSSRCWNKGPSLKRILMPVLSI